MARVCEGGELMWGSATVAGAWGAARSGPDLGQLNDFSHFKLKWAYQAVVYFHPFPQCIGVKLKIADLCPSWSLSVLWRPNPKAPRSFFCLAAFAAPLSQTALGWCTKLYYCLAKSISGSLRGKALLCFAAWGCPTPPMVVLQNLRLRKSWILKYMVRPV